MVPQVSVGREGGRDMRKDSDQVNDRFSAGVNGAGQDPQRSTGHVFNLDFAVLTSTVEAKKNNETKKHGVGSYIGTLNPFVKNPSEGRNRPKKVRRAQIFLERGACLCAPRDYLTQSVFKVVVQKSTPPRIRQFILYNY